MAGRRISGESTSDLYIRLGLSLDELESGFVDAQRTIRDNMSRLWRENTIIDLQARIELTGLDETADAERILEIRTRALNEQIKNQKDRVRLAAAELRNMEERTGANSDQSQRARIALEHHRLELARLEDQLRSLNETQEDDFDILGSLGERFDNFARQCWNVIGIMEVFGGAITELVDSFRELQTQAYELNMPVNDVENFLRHMRLAGGDIGDFEGFIRGITDAWVKGEWDDPEFIALSKYGAKITDATGRLKNFAEITEEVYQAYLKAKEAGEEIEFLQLVGGESGVRDSIQYFERYAEAKEDAEKIFDAGLDPDQLHEADRALTLVTEQLGEFKDAAVSVIIPNFINFMEKFFNVVVVGTEALVAYKDHLRESEEYVKSWETGEIFDSLFPDDAVDSQKQFNEALEETTASWADFQKECEKGLPDANPLSQYALKRIKDFRDELAELRIEIDYADNEYKQALAKLELWKKNELTDKLDVSDDERIAIEELYSAKLEQIEQERADKLAEIREKIAAEDRTALENKIAAIEKEKEEWISAGMEEAEAVELSQGLINKAREEATKKAREILQTTADLEYGLTHDALEKQIYEIERWKQAQLEKAETAEEVAATIANAAMKEAQAFEREMDRIKGKIESAQDRLARLTLSQYENDIRNAKKQYQTDIEDNVPQEIAQAIFEATMKQIQRRVRDDKGGEYRKSPNGGANYGISQMLEFGGALEQSTKSLVDLDAGQMALRATLEKVSGLGADIDQAMLRAGLSTSTFQDALKQSAVATQTSIDDFNQKMSDADDATMELRDVLKAAANETQGFSESAVRSALNIETSADTVRRAMDNFRAIEQQKQTANPHPQLPQSKKPLYDVIYGDDDMFAQNYRRGGVEVLYGDKAGEPIFDFDALKNSTGQVIESFDLLADTSGIIEQKMSELQPPDSANITQDLSAQLAELTRAAGEFAQSANRQPQQNITVSPTITIDLGGAYVFDNAMKAQLTDDIASKVADAVTDAVSRANSQANYSFGR